VYAKHKGLLAEFAIVKNTQDHHKAKISRLENQVAELLVENDQLQYQVIHEEYYEASNEFSYFYKRKDSSRVEAKPFHFVYLQVMGNTPVDECEVIIPRLNKSIETEYEGRGYYLNRLTEGDFTKENVIRFRIVLHPAPHPV